MHLIWEVHHVRQAVISRELTTYVFCCSAFQDNNDGLAAHWDFTGDPCPVDVFEWGIFKFDGTVIVNMTTLPPGYYRPVYLSNGDKLNSHQCDMDICDTCIFLSFLLKYSCHNNIL